jgi:2-aminoadipate transaminase
MTQQLSTLHEGLRLADWTQSMKRSVLRDMIAVVSRPGILSLAGGLPAPELFPTDAFAQATSHVLTTHPRALQYAPPFPALKAHIVELMAQRDVPCAEGEVFITTGAQQGLDVLARLLLNPGGQVLIEETVYTGIQQVIAPFQPEILTVPTDLETGMDTGAVEALLREGARPAFIYVIPDAHNPLGVSLSREKRRHLVELARRYAVPLIEDDPYGFLCYEQRPEPPLRALDSEWVFYLGSFSKILAPAVRTGWMIAPEALIPKLTVVKEASDLETSAFMQRAVAAFLDTGQLPDHLAILRLEYGMRRDTMLRMLEEQFPPEARWTRPTSGMFVWVELAAGTDTAALLKRAVEEEQVAFIPGHAFAVQGRSHANHCLRLNFSNATPERIEEGIRRLARVIRSG